MRGRVRESKAQDGGRCSGMTPGKEAAPSSEPVMEKKLYFSGLRRRRKRRSGGDADDRVFLDPSLNLYQEGSEAKAGNTGEGQRSSQPGLEPRSPRATATMRRSRKAAVTQLNPPFYNS